MSCLISYTALAIAVRKEYLVYLYMPQHTEDTFENKKYIPRNLQFYALYYLQKEKLEELIEINTYWKHEGKKYLIYVPN